MRYQLRYVRKTESCNITAWLWSQTLSDAGNPHELGVSALGTDRDQRGTLSSCRSE